LENSVLHGSLSARLQPHVSEKNFSHFESSNSCCFSHFLCLARKAFLMADCLDVEAVDGVEEQADDVCGVHMVSGTSG